MNPALDEVRKMLSSAEGQKAFVEWSANPVTQRLVAAAKEFAKPVCRLTPGVSMAEASIAALYKSLGAYDILDFFAAPNRFTEKKLESASPKPTYGAEKILATHGHAKLPAGYAGVKNEEDTP